MQKAILSVLILVIAGVAGWFLEFSPKNKPSLIVQNQQQTEVQVQKQSTQQKLVVSVQDPAKPFFTQNGRTATGFNVAFLGLLLNEPEFSQYNKAVVYKPVGTYEDVPKQLLTDKNINLAIDGLTFNDDDLPGVVYTTPYVKDFGYSLIVQKGNTINNTDDLIGKRIGIIKGDPDVRSLVETTFGKSKIVELSDVVSTDGKWMHHYFEKGLVDVVVFDYPFAVEEIKDTNLQFAMTKIKGSDIQYRIGLRQGDPMLYTMNAAIKRVTATEAYTDLLKQYFVSNQVSVRRASSAETVYVVIKGDTLSTIADSMLGNKMRYTEIQTRNNLPNPNLISVGQKLVIPK